MIKIRQARQDDLATLLIHAKNMFEESQYSQYSFNKHKVVRLFDGLISNPDGIVLVAEHPEDGIIGGFIGGIAPHWFGDLKTTFDFGVYVSPKHRGGRAGPMLVKAYIDEATRKGAAECSIGNTTMVNIDAVARMYEKLGFTKVGYNFKMKLGE